MLADTSTPLSNLTVQVYLPESAESTEVRRLDEVYSVNDFISGLVGDVTIVLAGPFHTIVMDSGTVTTELISTVQINVGGVVIKYTVW